MFSNRKQTLAIHPDDPVFRAAYLGKIEISNATKPSAVITAVQILWERAHKIGPEKLPLVAVTLGPTGIFLEDTRPKTNHQYQFNLSHISYCMANKGYGCVFAWVVAEPGRRGSGTADSRGSGSGNEQEEKKPRCHAIVCDREDIARAMALLMTAYFNAAYCDHKLKERRDTRKQVSREMMSDLESRAQPLMSPDSDTLSLSSSLRSASRQSSVRSTRSDSSEITSPIYAMVAKAIGVSTKALKETDSIAMRKSEEKLRSLRVNPEKIRGRGELESLFASVCESDVLY